jgi:hypothetical protein
MLANMEVDNFYDQKHKNEQRLTEEKFIGYSS